MQVSERPVASANWSTWSRLLVWGGLPTLFAGLYALAFLLPFPVLKWYGAPRFVTFVNMTEGGYFLIAVTLTVASLVLVLLADTLREMTRVYSRRVSLSMIVGGWLAASAVLLFVYPGQSSDVFDYILRAHMLGHLKVNPLAVAPLDVQPADVFPYASWQHVVDFYGPLWHAVSTVAHLIAGESILANILAYKIVGMLSMGIAGVLIYGALRQTAPEHAEAGLALWLWNPLVLNEAVMNAHNEVLTVIPIVAGMWLLLRKRPVAGVVMLITAGLVKATAWLLVPAALVWLLRQYGFKRAFVQGLTSGLFGLAVVLAAYAPFGGIQRLAPVFGDRSKWVIFTWQATLVHYLRDYQAWTQDDVNRVVLGAATVLFAIAFALILWRVRDVRVSTWGVLLAYLLIGCHWFFPWYATALVALAAIAANAQITRYTVVFTFFMLLNHIVVQFVLTPLAPDNTMYNLVAVTTTLLIPQLLALGMALSGLWPKRVPVQPAPLVAPSE